MRRIQPLRLENRGNTKAGKLGGREVMKLRGWDDGKKMEKGLAG
jgi:hypothetical protein